VRVGPCKGGRGLDWEIALELSRGRVLASHNRMGASGGGSDERKERGGSEKGTEDPSETARHVLEPNVRMLKVPWGAWGTQGEGTSRI